MKNPTKLLASLLGLTILIGLPVIAQDSRVEELSDDSNLSEQDMPEASDLTVEEGEMSEPMVDTAPASGNLVEQAASSEQFQTLASAIEVAGLEETLAGEGPYTVFAPTDEAFAALPPGTLEQLLQPENREVLVQLLSYHVVPGAVTSAEIQSGDVETLAGEPVAVELTPDGIVTVNNATVTQVDIPATNGVIHAVDQVILPPQ